MKAVVAEELSGPSGLVYTDVDDVPDHVDGAVVIDVRAAGLDDAQAAALLRNYATMYFALARRGALRPGESVLVLGSAGGVGVDIVVDPVGGDVFDDAIRALAPEGRLL